MTLQIQKPRRPTAAELRNRTPLDANEPIPMKAVVPRPASTAVTVEANSDYRVRYLDDVASVTMPGRIIKFSKDGKFVVTDDESEISENQDFIALCDETMVGWIKFNGPGEQPDRHMGLLYDGFVMPHRGTLGDNDESKWELGLNNEPDDPWKHQMCLVLQQVNTKEMFCFTTTSVTGRRAVGTLLRHYDRLQRNGADDIPVVRLRTGGFKHRNERVGWVTTPVFVVFGKAPRDSAARPDTSTAGYLNDSLPPSMQ